MSWSYVLGFIVMFLVVILSVNLYSNYIHKGAHNLDNLLGTYECGQGLVADLVSDGQAKSQGSACSSNKRCDDLIANDSFHYQYIGPMGCNEEKPNCCVLIKDSDQVVNGREDEPSTEAVNGQDSGST